MYIITFQFFDCCCLYIGAYLCTYSLFADVPAQDSSTFAPCYRPMVIDLLNNPTKSRVQTIYAGSSEERPTTFRCNNSVAHWPIAFKF